jgi:1,4-alpha-glucan branching enzyme
MELHERIGAWLTSSGCFFRVWAWHADRVQVVVQNGPYWEIDDAVIEQDLVRDHDGYWSGIVTGVQPYQLYRYRITNGGRVLERLDPAARDVIHSALTLDDPASRNASVVLGNEVFDWAPFQTPNFESFIIYELHVGTFAGRHDDLNKNWATFRDIENKLGYIRELGFNCIELLPLHEFAWDRSWGYNPASFFAPESSYGSPFNLKRLVDAAHRRGLAVIFDVVYNRRTATTCSMLMATRMKGIYFEGGPWTDWAADRRGGSARSRTTSIRTPGNGSSITMWTGCGST